MDDRFLHEQRRTPDPAFASGLRERLGEIEDETAPRRGFRFAPALAIAAGLAAVSALFLFPSVRVSAQAMLDLFRVRDFAVVQIDGQRLEQLRDRKLDLESLFGGKPEMTREPGPVQRFATLAAASAATGFAPERPEILPRSLALDSVFVTGEARARVTINTRPVRELMTAFDVRDLQIPAGIDGGVVDVHLPPVMAQSYRNDGHLHVTLLQGESPDVALPHGVALAPMGEIVLRLLGVERAEAHRLAGAIDWRSTFIVPVIANATTFQQVEVRGERGVYIETAAGKSADGTPRGPEAAVMWTRAGRVYALTGNLQRFGLLQMAESVR